ncbi:LOW QUALITY PROTEIN: microtubule organization protein AKNA [Pterocles gutturalis]
MAISSPRLTLAPEGHSGDDVTYIHDKDVPSLSLLPPGHEAWQVTVPPRPRAMASPAPWLRWTQTELTRWGGDQEEEEDDDDFKRRMDEDGVIGLGDDAGSPPWGDSEDPQEGSPAPEGSWHPRRDLAEEEEERGTSGGDEGPWGAESDGDPYPELSSGGCWGSGSSGSPEVLGDGRGPCQPRGHSTDGGDTSGLSDSSPSPSTPSPHHRRWDTAGDTGGGHGQVWTPSQSLRLRLPASDPHGATSTQPVPKPQPVGTVLPAPATTAMAPTGSQVTKKVSPTVRPPKLRQPARSLSPQQRWQAGGRDAGDPSRTGTGMADVTRRDTRCDTRYGRGRLNHPLPDLSKVQPRVKFDRSYRPPRGRALPPRPRAPPGPPGFKSPAEIVRDVLLSSGEGVPTKPPTTEGLPQELRSPRRATELVQQLQDDYRKLLTKYAEAENTIDQLRLGARVSLYADPPRPSRSLAVGTVGSGCRGVTLSIPQAHTATFSMAPTPAPPSLPGSAPALGPPDRGASPQPPSPPPPGGGCPTCVGLCRCPGMWLTPRLAGQTQELRAQVESFEGWMRAGTPTPREQLQRFGILKDAQDALERAYLRARQQHPGGSGEFDPDRAVEGEIFCLGLRLEELKERLELGGQRQPSPKPPAQPHSPPDPSPPPEAPSPYPESPAVMEGPRGTVGDKKAVTGGLPRRLWQKQLRVEEDFGDLLAQYQRFKSLPESLSLEQLSLAASGSPEEVDGPAVGDGGHSKVPCRTPSPEEGTDLETSPLHPPKRRAALLPPGEPPWPGGTQGHLSPATAEELPAAAKPPWGVPEPPRASQHHVRKEQRIVSPETDSGFVGSEASRVSPPVHTPEHRPPGTGTHSSLGPSIPIPSTLRPPRKNEVTPLPPEPALMDIYPPGRQGGMGGSCRPPSTPSQSSTPPRWAQSAGSEGGPDGGTHTDSEAEGRSCASAGSADPAMDGDPGSPPSSPETPSPTLLSPDPLSPTPLSPNLPSLDPACCDLLGSRLERDQAIRALRDEVWRLRRRLEETLRRSRSCPGGKAPPARRQPAARGISATKDAAPTGEPSPPTRGRVAPRVTPRRRGRSASLPRDRPELELTLGLGPTGSHPLSLSSATASKSDPSPTAPRATPSPRKSPGSTPGTVTFQGQYTGTRYQGGTPRAAQAPREEPGTPGCPRCHRSGTSASSRGDDAAGQPQQSPQPQHSTPRRTRCPTCRAPMGAPTPSGRDRATHAERGPGDTSPPGSRTAPRTEKLEQPRLWYLGATPGATTAAISCLAPVPLVPYTPSVLYCSPVVPTSAPPQHTMGHRRAEHPLRRPRRCLALEELGELERALGRAVAAARGVRVTTTRMSRVLATELGRARDLRGSGLL